MSMNLQCKQHNLIQLPTYISYLIYSDKDGGADGILYRYEMYIRHLYQEAFNKNVKNPKKQKEVEDTYEMILKDIELMNESVEELEFYIL